MITETTARTLELLGSKRLMFPKDSWFQSKDYTGDSLEKQREFYSKFLVGEDRYPVIDVQDIYDDWITQPTSTEFGLYDAEMRPPWTDAFFVYENRHGNGILLATSNKDYKDTGVPEDDQWTADFDWDDEAEPDDHDVEWDRVRWLWVVSIFVQKPNWVVGPCQYMRIAVYDDGEIADINCQAIVKTGYLADLSVFQTELSMMMKAVDIANCRNVITVESKASGPRAMRRRIERSLGDIRVSNLAVEPMGKSYRGTSTASSPGLTPLSTVRGHVAHYGACCSSHPPKGLLFGKYEGKVWVPKHARGSAEHGENRNDYRVEPE